MENNGLPQGFALDQPVAEEQSPQPEVTPSVPQGFQLDDEKYGTPGQTALGVGERIAKGFAGPLVEGAEKIGTSLGIPGLTPQDQAGRAAALPTGVGPLSEAAGFAGSMLTGVGEGKLVGELGEGAAKLAGLAGDGAGAITKVASTGIRGYAEMAAIQSGDEIGKAINEDPSQTLGTAAINVGLSGIIGGVGGAALGSVSPLWETAKNKIGVEKFSSDYMGESKFLKENPDPVTGAQQEINDRIGSADQLLNGGLKKELIEKLTSDLKPEQVQAHIDHVEELIAKAPAALKKEPLFQDAVEQWRKVVPSSVEQGAQELPSGEFHEQLPLSNIESKPISFSQDTQPGALPSLGDLKYSSEAVESPTLGSSEKFQVGSGSQPSLGLPPTKQELPDPSSVFKATENLKIQFQEWSQYNKALVPIAERPFRDASKVMASDLRESLENPSHWGEAGNVQRAYNKAISPLYEIQKEFLGKFASKEMGEKVADPTKINSYLNQAEKSKAGLKSNYVRNYLDQTQKAADAINESYINNGLEQPLEEKLNPTPVLNHALETEPSPGVTLARWVNRKGTSALGNAVGETGAAAVGGSLGAIVGHPLVGAWMGERVLTPLFSAIAKPLAETAINSSAAKASADYVGNVIKGDRLFSDSVKSFFKSGALIFQKDLIPSVASTDKLQKSLDYASNPQNALNVGGSLGHYMPNHQTAAAMMSQTAVNYYNSIKPKTPQSAPLNKPTPASRYAQQQYERQLGIGQQPLMVLKYAKEGKLNSQDVKTLNTIYPGLAKKYSTSLFSEMTKSISEGRTVPYFQRTNLSMLMGQPLDGSLTPSAATAIIHANAGATTENSNPQGPKGKKAGTGVALKQINKVTDLYKTPSEVRASNKQD